MKIKRDMFCFVCLTVNNVNLFMYRGFNLGKTQETFYL